MKEILRFWVVVLWLCFAAGCATPRDTTEVAGIATCCVCRYNNDLACVKVKVSDSTPRADYQGVSYCFCSEDCRVAFLKNPRRYVR